MKKQILVGLSLLSLGGIAVTYRSVGSIQSYNRDTSVHNVPIYYPESVTEVQSLVKDAYQRNINVRFSGASHSTSSVILGQGIYIKSDRFNHILGIENHPQFGPLVSVESGVKLGQLSDFLAQKGYSLGFAYPFYDGVSIGGLLSTGSHGSSRRHVAQSSQNVMEMTLVDGTGELVTINSQTPEKLKAARVSLGLLGFIYKVKLRIYKDFNIQVKSTVLEGRTALLQPDGQINWGAPADTEYVYWFPHDNRGAKIEGHIVNKPADPGAECVVLGVSNNDDLETRAMAKILMWGKDNSALNKKLEDVTFKNVSGAPPYVRLENKKFVKAQNVVGTSSKMLISKRIPLSPVFTATDISFSFRMQDAPQVLARIHEFSKRNKMYLPFIGIFMRFASARSAAYISHIERPGVARDIYVMAEFFEPKYYTPVVAPSAVSVMRQQLLQLLTSQNLISFHWGKNLDSIFSFQANKTLLGSNISAFNKVRQSMDPKGIFINPFAQSFVIP